MGELRASTKREETIEDDMDERQVLSLARDASINLDATDALLDASQLYFVHSRCKPHRCGPISEHTHVMSDVHMELDQVDQAGDGRPASPEDKPSDRSKGKARATAKPTAALVREAGKSLLPISRVQKIMKADKVRPS